MNAIGIRRRACLGFGLLAAALLAPSSASGLPRVLRIGANGHLTRVAAFADLSDGELLRRAAIAGPLNVRSGEHLSGRVFAEGVHFVGAGPVTVEPGTVIFSHGDIVIDAPIVAMRTTPDVPRKNAAVGGGDGADGRGLVLTCDQAGDVVVNQPIQLEDGVAGGAVTVTGPNGRGGDGGDGGGVHIVCPNKVTISANIAPGRGGDGGSADVTGHDGAADQNGETVKSACGGKGGAGGVVEIRAKEIEFTKNVDGKADGRIALRPGGNGGNARAQGGNAGPTTDCTELAPDGGDATARGGAAGPGSGVVVEATKTLTPAEFKATDISGFDATESANGGTAKAYGGKGADGLTCVVQGCPSKGRSAGPAGDGGDAFAYGGTGGTGAKIGGGKGVLRKRAASGAEAPPGRGGDAVAVGGTGGVAGNGEDAKAPGNGGGGGHGGMAKAFGGMGGSSTLGQKAGVPLADNQGPLKGGPGGDADATGGDSGNSGNGGNCCENSAHSGGRGGYAVGGGKGRATGGPGGKGHVKGDKGAQTANDGKSGAKGVNGEDCPAYVNADCYVTSYVQNPATHLVPFEAWAQFFNTSPDAKSVLLEFCCDGRKIAGCSFNLVIPGGSTVAPGTLKQQCFIVIKNPHPGHHISIMVNGKVIAVHVINVF